MSNLNEDTIASSVSNKTPMQYRTPPPPPSQPPAVKHSISSSAPATSVSPPPPQVPLRLRSSANRETNTTTINENQQQTAKPLPPPPPPPRDAAIKSPQSPANATATVYENATNAAARLVYKTAQTGSVQSLNNNHSQVGKNILTGSNKMPSNDLNNDQRQQEEEKREKSESDLKNKKNSSELVDLVGNMTSNSATNQESISNLTSKLNLSKATESPQSYSYSSSPFSSRSNVVPNVIPNTVLNKSSKNGNGSGSNYPWVLLDGETFVNENETPHSEIIFVMPDDRGIRGKLFITNYRLYFKSDELQIYQSYLIINLPLGLIHRIEKIGHQSTKKSNFYGLLINCKNGRRLRFATVQENVSRKQIYEILQKYSFPISNSINYFAYSFNQSYVDSSGWQIYDVKREYERIGISKSNDWRFTHINQQFKFCETYPKILVVPQSVSDDDLKQIAEFRSKKRIPVVSWLKYDDRKNSIALLRSSQPMVGLTQKRSEKDENYLYKVCKLNTVNSLDKLFIMDARPLANAVVNRGNGGGYENEDNYNFCEISFLNIQNIHVMRECLRKIFDMAMPSSTQTNSLGSHFTTGFNSATLSFNSQASNHPRQTINFGVNINNGASSAQNNSNNSVGAVGSSANSSNWNDDKNYFINLENSKWLEHIRLILNGALKIVKYINDHRSSVLVHCSDGWDRTAQLTSLSMLMMDNYYRTIKGFEVLIEKEWISFGHRFGTRMGHGSDKHSDQDRSPVFLQFIDCVWQILQQNGRVFEFNEKFLFTILSSMYTCQFGTFLFNNEFEREKNDVRNKTVSLWSYINSNKNDFKNSSYVEYDGVVELSTSYSALQLWTAYYFQYKDVIDDSLTEISPNSPSNQLQISQTLGFPQTFLTPPMPSKWSGGQAFLQQVVNQMKKASTGRNVTQQQEPELIKYKACMPSDICN